jgi:hypothetical protein
VRAGETRTITGTIASLPLVEGSYRLGVYLVSGDFMGNRFGLCDLTVAAKAGPAGHAPYPAEYRGVVELEFTVS